MAEALATQALRGASRSRAAGASWIAMGTRSTGTFDCMAEPGGTMLCLKTCFCGCLTVGETNEAIGGPGGWIGGVVGDLILSAVDLYWLFPMYHGLEVSKKAGF